MAELPSGTITFLFTDVHDSTRLWEKYPAAMGQALQRHDEIIESLSQLYHGHVVRPRGEGDSRFIVFERAFDGVSAAAAIQQALHTEDWPEEFTLRVRMGVHTGEGQFRDGDYYGSAVNRCARLRSIAHGGQTLLSQTIYELGQDNLPKGVELLDLGEHPLKGLTRAEHIYQIMAPGLPTDFPPLSLDWKIPDIPSKLPPFLERDVDDEKSIAARPVFVAREPELARLNAFLEKAVAGNGQIVFITGGAGRGKSALAEAFARRAMEVHPELLVSFGKCNAQSGFGDPYLPFREALNTLTGGLESAWSTGKISTESAARLWSSTPRVVQTILEVGPELVDMLIPANVLQARASTIGGDSLVTELEEFLKRKAIFLASSSLKQLDLFEQLTRVLRSLAEQSPLLLIFDDFQWADDASISLLFHLGRRIANRPILLLCAYRPGEVALGRDGDRHPLDQVVNELKRVQGEVILDLSTTEGGDEMDFVDAFLDSEPNLLGAGFRQALFDHTGGHPLFTVELLRAMQERGDLILDAEGNWVEGEKLDWDRLPARVEAVIEERFARLEEKIRDLLSVASVEGKEFTAQVLARVQNIEERKLLRELTQELSKRHRLVRELGEVEVGRQILSKFQFAHHLFQRYLYNGMSAAERRLLHGEITTVLEDIFSGDEERIAVQLAYHSQRANLAEKAIRYLRLAGDQSRTSYANQEALRYYSELLSLLPAEGPERFEVLALRASVYDVVADRQAQLADAEEMLAISKTLHDDTLQFDALLALAAVYLESEHVLAEEPSEKALDLARKLGDPVLEASALQCLGWGAWLKSDYEVSREYLEEAVTRFKQANILDKAASCLTPLSLALGALYENSAAMEVAREAVELSRKIGDPRMEATSLRRLAIAHFNLDQYTEALPIAEQALALHREVGDRSEEAHALNVLGIIYGWLDRWNEHEAALRKSLQIGHDLRSTTTVQFTTWNLATTHYWREGRYEGAIRFVEEELEWALAAEDNWLIGALNYNKGWFLYEVGQYDASLATFEIALSTLEEIAPEGRVYVITLAWIGLQHALIGTRISAEEHSDRAKELADRLPSPADRIWIVLINAKIALLLGEKERLQQARQEIDESLEIVLRSDEHELIEELLNTSAQLRLVEDDIEGAYERSSELARLLDYVPAHPAPQDYAYTHAQLLHALGRTKEAESYIKRAYDWIILVADKTENEAWRQSWLEDARRNKEILEVAAEMGIA
jgi:predicted ATPase/class 3 adenylate cyclase